MVVARVMPVVTQLAAQGIGVLLIEQFTHIALRLAHHVCVMERGRIRFSGTVTEMTDNEALRRAYFGLK